MFIYTGTLLPVMYMYKCDSYTVCSNTREGIIQCSFRLQLKHSTYTCIGLSITLKAERGIPDWLWGAVAQWSEHLQLKQEALGSIPSGCPGFFLFQLAYTNVNGMKDLWCSSTVWLLSTQI